MILQTIQYHVCVCSSYLEDNLRVLQWYTHALVFCASPQEKLLKYQ